MTKRFEITIMATVTEKVRVSKIWTRLKDKTDDDTGMGYTPGDWDVDDVSREIYKQVVDGLDLPTVIAAVNSMAHPPINRDELHIPVSECDGEVVRLSDINEELEKAVEYGGYLAKTAEQFMATLTEKDADAVGDMWGSMRMAIFDFRKRVDTLT